MTTDQRIRISTVLLALGILPLSMMAAGGIPQLTETSHFDDVGNAYSEEGTVKLELREVRTEEIVENAKPVPLRILVLFEPHSGAFSWRVFGDDLLGADAPSQSLVFKNYRAVLLKDNRLVEFIVALAPTRLFINEYSGHASSMDDAEAQALRSASEPPDPSGDRNQRKRMVCAVLVGGGVSMNWVGN